MIYVTLVRAGKQALTVEVAPGTTLRGVLEAGSLSGFDGWSFTGEAGESLSLGDTITRSTQVICGARVDGAVV